MREAAQSDIPRILKEYVHSSDHADLVAYRDGLTDPGYFDIWLWRTKHYCDLAGFYRKRILEVGCGLGWDAVGLALTGGNEVVASDILPSMIEGMSQCLEGMKAQRNIALPVTPLQGDICKLALPSESFDGIFSTEAIEHVHDLGLMFDNCFRLLRPGGTVLLVNDSNRYNAAAREHSWAGWTDRDESWEHSEWLKSEVRPIEHADAKPYAAMREEIIRAANPELTDEEVAALRRGTAGMIRPEIESLAKAFRENGVLPPRDEFGWCRNPETGEYSERLLDPFELKQMLKARGFKVRLRHVFRKMPMRLFNPIQFRPLNMRLFALRPLFALVATKPR